VAEAIRALIAQTYTWEREHVAAHRRVEAMACAIRRAALEDALAIVTSSPHRPGSPQIPARGRVPPSPYP
jgi:phosphoribosylcarboxyaminoimidazole (NCAIR) mutase